MPPQPTDSIVTIVLSLFAGIVVGPLCGLIPLTVGKSRDRPYFGLLGLAMCLVGAYLMSFVGALTMAAIMSLAILGAGPTKKTLAAQPAIQPVPAEALEAVQEPSSGPSVA